MSLLEVEGDLHGVADFDLVDERNLGDHVDSAEIGVDIVFVAKKLGDGDLDFVGVAKSFVVGIVLDVMDVFRTDAIDDRMTAFEAGFDSGIVTDVPVTLEFESSALPISPETPSLIFTR